MIIETMHTIPCAIGYNNSIQDCCSGLLIFDRELKNLYVISTCSSNLENKEGKKNVKLLIRNRQSVRTLQASFILAWECSPLANHIDAIFKPKCDWSLTYDHDVDRGVSLAIFVLYKVNNREVSRSDLDEMLYHSSYLFQGVDLLRTGCSVITRSYPFGPDALEIFTDAVSCGVISNISSNNEMFLTDARCLPGSEGGGVYLKHGSSSIHHEQLVGMIVSPLCWKTNELVGFSICCSMRTLFESLQNAMNLIPNLDDLTEEKYFFNLCLKDLQSENVSNHRLNQPRNPTVVRIDVGGVWGSGVVVASVSSGRVCDVVIVTCRHVVENAIERQDCNINVTFDNVVERFEGRIVFATKEDSVYDLAILKLISNTTILENLYLNDLAQKERSKKHLFVVPYATCTNEYTKQTPVHVKGYPLFEASSMPCASVSSGILSNTVYYNGSPVLLHSTCLVHKGGSGGGLICSKTGKLQGIVVNHVKDEIENISYPDVNFSIPACIFMPCMIKYLTSDGDLTVFNILNCYDKEIERIWNLEPPSYNSMHIIKSKL